jgi:drug/metabolite transporter (DMT)-like permease
MSVRTVAAASPARRLVSGAGLPALFVLLWSTGFVVAKEAVKHADPMVILLLRFGGAAVLALALGLALRVTWPTRREALHAAVIGLLVQACYIGGVYAAIDHGLPAGVASLVVGLQPLLSAGVVGLALGDRVTPLQWAGCVLGLAGVVLVLLTKLTFDGATVGAIFLTVLALVGITAGTLYQKRFATHLDVIGAQTVQYVAATVVVLPFALALDSTDVRWTAGFVGSLAWMIVVLSLGTISLLALLIRHGHAVQTASLFYLVPPVTALMAWIWFDETLAPAALAGMAVTALGVALVQRGGRTVTPAVPE